MTTTIRLDKPIQWMGKSITELRLREPTGQQFIDLGEPRIAVGAPGGGGYFVEQPHVVKAYLDACIDHDGRGALLALIGFADARRLKDELFDFFRAASETPTGSPLAPSSSD